MSVLKCSVKGTLHVVQMLTLAWLSSALRPVRYLAWDKYKTNISRIFFAYGLVLTRVVLVKLLVLLQVVQRKRGLLEQT